MTTMIQPPVCLTVNDDVYTDKYWRKPNCSEYEETDKPKKNISDDKQGVLSLWPTSHSLFGSLSTTRPYLWLSFSKADTVV